MPTVHIVIRGKVQGVFYRATAKDVAEKLELKGWVRNSDSGDVEALVTGGKEQLQEFIDWCKQGPAKAVVTDVEVTEKAEEAFDRFKIIR